MRIFLLCIAVIELLLTRIVDGTYRYSSARYTSRSYSSGASCSTDQCTYIAIGVGCAAGLFILIAVGLLVYFRCLSCIHAVVQVYIYLKAAYCIYIKVTFA
ncbi:unnamed protein product [Adineta ricciae]|uniref:Uncharacterized protein n=1 Tax=Adineta ricciae TaxID=249248 RepID=A0A816DRC0_ADIRI|nr:unnamed protein product [Adineta ricciae]